MEVRRNLSILTCSNVKMHDIMLQKNTDELMTTREFTETQDGSEPKPRIPPVCPSAVHGFVVWHDL